MEKKLKKTVKLENGESKRNQLLEQITETTFQRTRTEQRGSTGNESESSDSDVQQVEWRVTPKNVRTDGNQHCQGRNQRNKCLFGI